MTYRPQLYPVSVKGVIVKAGLVLLLRNERDEWELPGGKLELGEDPARCAEREIAEEVGWKVAAVGQHQEAGLFTGREAADLRMPDGYKKSIATWYRQLGA